MVDPVPTQCMMVDREFPRRPFDRRTGGKKPFDQVGYRHYRAVITRYKFAIFVGRKPFLPGKFFEGHKAGKADGARKRFSDGTLSGMQAPRTRAFNTLVPEYC
jgi:hypothetical protein